MTAPVPDGQGGPMMALTALMGLGDKATDRVRKSLVAYAVGATAAKVGKQWWDKVKAERTYTVSLRGDDDIYGDVHMWLLSKIPSEKRRSLIAKSSRRDTISPSDSPGSTVASGLRLYYDGTRTQTVELEGHRIQVSVYKPDIPDFIKLGDDTARWMTTQERIVFFCRSQPAREAVLRFLSEIAASQQKREPRFYMAMRWGDWRQQSEMQRRPLETVVLRAGQKEALVDDLAKFLAMEKDYERLGLPWHRGYLFQGPPGTGKTSIAKALAGHFRMDVYYMALGAVDGDNNLFSMFGQIQPRCMLVLEDIDIIRSAHERGEEQSAGSGITLDGLLNVLDGFVTPHGLVTVMTTNDASVLDPALVRHGRVDRTENVGYLDNEQFSSLVKVFTGWEMPAVKLARQMTPAEVVDVIKANLDDPAATRAALRAMLRGGP